MEPSRSMCLSAREGPGRIAFHLIALLSGHIAVSAAAQEPVREPVSEPVSDPLAEAVANALAEPASDPAVESAAAGTTAASTAGAAGSAAASVLVVYAPPPYCGAEYCGASAAVAVGEREVEGSTGEVMVKPCG